MSSETRDGKELCNGEVEMWNLAGTSKNASISLFVRDGQGKYCGS